jgi:lipopolysaccharide biosynthesis regulator YciM
MALAESQTDEAARFANQALDLATKLEEAPSVADAHIWLGQIAAFLGQDATVDVEFAAAFDLLEQPGASADRSSRAQAHYAEILEARGDMAGAVQHLKQALATRPPQRSVDSRAASA